MNLRHSEEQPCSSYIFLYNSSPVKYAITFDTTSLFEIPHITSLLESDIYLYMTSMIALRLLHTTPMHCLFFLRLNSLSTSEITL